MSAQVVCPSSEPTTGWYHASPVLAPPCFSVLEKMLPAHGAVLLLCNAFAVSHLGRGKGLLCSGSSAGLTKALPSSVRGWALSLLVAEGWWCMCPSSWEHKVSLPPLLITI